ITGSAENRRALWADGLACDLAARVEDAEQHRGTKPLPEEPINLASYAGTTQRVRGRRAYVDRYAAWRDGARPHREQAILAALKAALILAENAGALLKQHDAAIIGVDIARDDAGCIARYGAVDSRLQRAREDGSRSDQIVAVADHARCSGADRRGLLEIVQVGPRRSGPSVTLRVPGTSAGDVADRASDPLVPVVRDQRRSPGIVAQHTRRPGARRVGKEGGSPCGYRWSADS